VQAYRIGFGQGEGGEVSGLIRLQVFFVELSEFLWAGLWPGKEYLVLLPVDADTGNPFGELGHHVFPEAQRRELGPAGGLRAGLEDPIEGKMEIPMRHAADGQREAGGQAVSRWNAC